MKRTLAALLAVGLLAGPALAQSKLDQAIAKAEDQVAKGKPDEAVKTLTKAAAEAGPEGQVALARLQERVGNLDAAAAAYNQAKSAGAGNPDVLAAVANFTLRHGKAQDALAIAKQAVAAGATPAALGAMARAQVRMEDGPGALAHQFQAQVDVQFRGDLARQLLEPLAALATRSQDRDVHGMPPRTSPVRTPRPGPRIDGVGSNVGPRTHRFLANGQRDPSAHRPRAGGGPFSAARAAAACSVPSRSSSASRTTTRQRCRDHA